MNSKKMLIFSATYRHFSKDSMSLSGCQINPIDVNFHLQNSLKFFDKNSAEKVLSKKDKEIKVSPLMPIRVKSLSILASKILSDEQIVSFP